jgi:hypothetical protein
MHDGRELGPDVDGQQSSMTPIAEMCRSTVVRKWRVSTDGGRYSKDTYVESEHKGLAREAVVQSAFPTP